MSDPSKPGYTLPTPEQIRALIAEVGACEIPDGIVPVRPAQDGECVSYKLVRGKLLPSDDFAPLTHYLVYGLVAGINATPNIRDAPRMGFRNVEHYKNFLKEPCYTYLPDRLKFISFFVQEVSRREAAQLIRDLAQALKLEIKSENEIKAIANQEVDAFLLREEQKKDAQVKIDTFMKAALQTMDRPVEAVVNLIDRADLMARLPVTNRLRDSRPLEHLLNQWVEESQSVEIVVLPNGFGEYVARAVVLWNEEHPDKQIVGDVEVFKEACALFYRSPSTSSPARGGRR